MPATPASEYLTYQQAAFEFAVSVSTISRLAAAGTVTRYTSARDGRRALFKRDDLAQALTAMNTPRLAG